MIVRLGVLFGVAFLICAGGVLMSAPEGNEMIVRLHSARPGILPFEIPLLGAPRVERPPSPRRDLDGIALPLYEGEGLGRDAPIESSKESSLTGGFAEVFRRLYVAFGFLVGLSCCFIAFARNHVEHQFALAAVGLLLLIAGGMEGIFYFWTRDWPTLIVPILAMISGYCCFLSVPFARIGALSYGVVRGVGAIVFGSYLEIVNVGASSWLGTLTAAQGLLWPVVVVWFFSLPWVREHLAKVEAVRTSSA